MAITIQAASDADIPSACEAEHLAYSNNPANSILFPGPFAPDSTRKRCESLIEMRKNDPTATYLKAVDDVTGELVAFAKWHIYETREVAASAPSRPLNFGQGTNREACVAFFGGLVEKKNAIMGTRPHLYLHMLHTDPKHQGRGAGAALLKWGTQKADKLGLPVYLESSPEGHRLYEKHGFKDVQVFKLDLSKFGGGNTLHTAPLMVREPAKPSTSTSL